jgi:hypothetical protein
MFVMPGAICMVIEVAVSDLKQYDQGIRRGLTRIAICLSDFGAS